jgi:hypothetical protein
MFFTNLSYLGQVLVAQAQSGAIATPTSTATLSFFDWAAFPASCNVSLM